MAVMEGITAGAAPAPKKPCKCQEKGETMDPFASELAPLGAITPESVGAILDAALAAGNGADAAAADLALDESLLFGDLPDSSSLTLEDVLDLAESNPGLKITFSF